MISYKYKLYQTKRTKHIDKMMVEACQVWNHAISLQKRYYRIYKGYISCTKMQHHYAMRFKRDYISARCVQEILQRLDSAYRRFFKKLAKRPPKYKKIKNITLIFLAKKKIYLDGCSLNNNILHINKCNKSFKFYLSRQYKGNIIKVQLKKDCCGDYFISIITDNCGDKYEKTHNGASVGIDFGIKTYLTSSNGAKIEGPRFLSNYSNKIKKLSKDYAKNKKDFSKIARIYRIVNNKKKDFQWKLAHELCKKFDNIFVEDLNLKGMRNLKRCSHKLYDYSHYSFIEKLLCVAAKYNVTIHKIDRFYPSSKTCECGYVNKGLTLYNREWMCPKCGMIHDRDILAAKNILRRGIYEMGSVYKTEKHYA